MPNVHHNVSEYDQKYNKCRYGQPYGMLLSRHKRRWPNVEPIEYDDFEALVQQDCKYCGCRPKSRTPYRHYKYHSLTRLDPKFGYADYNVAPACYTCHRMKGGMHDSKFIDHLYAIEQYQRLLILDAL